MTTVLCFFFLHNPPEPEVTSSGDHRLRQHRQRRAMLRHLIKQQDDEFVLAVVKRVVGEI